MDVPAWPHRHLLDADGLSRDELETVMSLAEQMAEARASREPLALLRGRQLTTLFYEASTRTRVSFEVAARALGAEVDTVSVSLSSVTKGESLVDTVRTLEALGTDLLVMRHSRSGAPYLAARHARGSIVNAGDGWHAHPTQALLDLFTLRRRLPGRSVAGRRIVIVGDLLRSRVARSNIWTLTAAGANVVLCAPRALLAGFESWAGALPPDRQLSVTDDLESALRGADAVMALRIQRERDAGSGLPSVADYVAGYGLSASRLREAKPEVLLMHPGPVNEGVEVTAEVANGASSLILEQVANGVPVRMAVLALLARGAA
ncbi:MAG: aspartate carbamoyltransferase catalytic subunit [Chloroflexi bacterium]|nr:aspartate carbamoyltransferase catalytic subunit [Chloroflexota bacterium]